MGKNFGTVELKYLSRLDYNPNTGIFTYSHNNRIAGSIDSKGYVVIKLGRIKFLAHRLAWFKTYGKMPEKVIDHINGVTSDNRIKNLRDVSHGKNMQNSYRHRGGKLCGAFFCKRRNKWFSRIVVRKKAYFLGYFKSAKEAHMAYMGAASEMVNG